MAIKRPEITWGLEHGIHTGYAGTHTICKIYPLTGHTHEYKAILVYSVESTKHDDIGAAKAFCEGCFNQWFEGFYEVTK